MRTALSRAESLLLAGLAALLVLVLCHSRHAALAVRWGLVLLAYAVAKLLELHDQEVFALTAQWVSGHTLKHVIAAVAAGPVIYALWNSGESRQNAAKATSQAGRRAGHA